MNVVSHDELAKRFPKIQIARSAVIYDNVEFLGDCIVEDFCIIGSPFNQYQGQKTQIGNGATFRSHTVLYAGNIIGHHFMTGNKANIRELNNIGNDVSVGTLSVVEHHVKIGDGVRIHTQVFIPEYSTLEDGAWIGPNVVFTNARYPLSPNAKNELQGPLIRKAAIIGANSTLLPGIEIGENALVGAGSVVVKSVPPFMVVAGNPASIRKNIQDLPYGRLE